MVDPAATWALAMLARCDVEAFGATREPLPIVGGSEVDACGFPSVVAMLEDDETPVLCTGSLVHPEIVLTAAHCVIEDRPIVAVGFGEVGQGEPGLARTIDIVECFDAGELGDIGYCVLAEPVDDVPIVPLLLGCDADTLVEGGEVTIVGFGASFAGPDPTGEALLYEGLGIKRSVVQTLDSVGPGVVSMVGSNGSESACFGDSGGPAMVELGDGTWRVFGVASVLYDPGGFPEPMQPGNICGVGVEYTNTTGHVAALESLTGVDLSPCHDADGMWDPSAACAAIPTSPQLGAGEWATGCAGGPLGGGAPLCGDGIGTDSGSDDDGSTDGSTDDDSTGVDDASDCDGAAGTSTSDGEGTEATGNPDPTSSSATSSGTSSGEDDAREDPPLVGDRGCACTTAPPHRGGLPGLVVGLLALCGRARPRAAAHAARAGTPGRPT